MVNSVRPAEAAQAGTWCGGACGRRRDEFDPLCPAPAL